jgi:hypothetical protein
MVAEEEEKRISINVRLDPQKYAALENLRETGFAMAQTKRNRSDVANEVIGYGLNLLMLKKELGDREFEQVWKLLNKLNLKKLNLEKVEKLLS